MGEAGCLEQGRLGARVGVHVRVVVEVVAAQVGEHPGVDVHRVDPALNERVGRDLHDQRVDPGVAQVRKQAMDLDRTRSGEGRGIQRPRAAGAQGADHRAAVAAAARGEMRDARLSVRSGHRGDGQAGRRISVEARRRVPHRARDVGDADHHRARVEPRPRRSALDDDGRGAGCDRAGREPARIDPQAPAREEQRAGHDRPAVVAYRGHRPVEPGGNRGVSFEQRPQARAGRRRVRRVHGVPSAAAAATLMVGPIAGFRITSGSSGATPSTRNEPSTMSENTGAATAPP